jgi:hypothetical protein
MRILLPFTKHWCSETLGEITPVAWQEINEFSPLALHIRSPLGCGVITLEQRAVVLHMSSGTKQGCADPDHFGASAFPMLDHMRSCEQPWKMHQHESNPWFGPVVWRSLSNTYQVCDTWNRSGYEAPRPTLQRCKHLTLTAPPPLPSPCASPGSEEEIPPLQLPLPGPAACSDSEEEIPPPPPSRKKPHACDSTKPPPPPPPQHVIDDWKLASADIHNVHYMAGDSVPESGAVWHEKACKCEQPPLQLPKEPPPPPMAYGRAAMLQSADWKCLRPDCPYPRGGRGSDDYCCYRCESAHHAGVERLYRSPKTGEPWKSPHGPECTKHKLDQ